MNDIELFKKAIDSGNVRKSQDGKQASVHDMIRELTGLKAPRIQWNRLKNNHLEIVSRCNNLQVPGVTKPTPFADAQTLVEIIMVLPGRMADEFRRAAAKLVIAYMNADIRLADDIIQRNNNPQDLEWMRCRLEGKQRRLTFTNAIRDHGGEARTYAVASDINNRAIVGMTARQIQKTRGVKHTRDGLSAVELALVGAAESLESEKIERRNVRGHAAICGIVGSVASDLAALARKHLA